MLFERGKIWELRDIGLDLVKGILRVLSGEELWLLQDEIHGVFVRGDDLESMLVDGENGTNEEILGFDVLASVVVSVSLFFKEFSPLKTRIALVD